MPHSETPITERAHGGGGVLNRFIHLKGPSERDGLCSDDGDGRGRRPVRQGSRELDLIANSRSASELAWGPPSPISFSEMQMSQRSDLFD